MNLQYVPGQNPPPTLTRYRSPGPWASGQMSIRADEFRLHKLEGQIYDAHERFLAAVPRHSPEADRISVRTLRDEAMTRRAELDQRVTRPSLDLERIENDFMLRGLRRHDGASLGELQASARSHASRWSRIASVAAGAAALCASGTVLAGAALLLTPLPAAGTALVAAGTFLTGMLLACSVPNMRERSEDSETFALAIESRAENFDDLSGWKVPDLTAHPARIERDHLIRERNELVAGMRQL